MQHRPVALPSLPQQTRSLARIGHPVGGQPCRSRVTQHDAVHLTRQPHPRQSALAGVEPVHGPDDRVHHASG